MNTNGLKGVSASDRCLVSIQIITYLSYLTKAEGYQTKSNYMTEFVFPQEDWLVKLWLLLSDKNLITLKIIIL